MTIANRVGALVAAALIVFLAIDAFVLHRVVLPSFEGLDDLHAREDMRRVQAELENDLVQLDRFATDWAAWDDAYAFAHDRNNAFIAGNLETKVMFEQRLALLWFVDTEGRTIWGRALDPNNSTPKPHPLFPGQQLPLDSPVLALKEIDIGLTGFVETPLGLMLIAARPIVTSHFQGPLRGYLIVGKLLDDRHFAALGKRTGSQVYGLPAALMNKDSEDAHLLSVLTPGDIRLGLDSAGDKLFATASLYDLGGRPVMLLKTAFGRQHVKLGRETLNVALLVLAISGAALMGVVYVMLHVYVSRPLKHLAHDIKYLGKASPEAREVVSDGLGEVAAVKQEVKGMLDRIAYLSHTDSLTGLPNRASFNLHASHALALARRHETQSAVLLLDLDGFKEVNETLGHEAGDRLLMAVSERLKGVLRESDSLARFGGDEFLIMAENLPAVTGAADLARRILDIFKQPLIAEDIRHGRGCSIGIAIFPNDAQTLDDLLRMADIAMYRAKSSGGNTWRCHAESLECRHEKGPENSPAPSQAES